MQLLDDSVTETRLSVLLNVAAVKLRVTSAEFDLLCLTNPDIRLELTKDGELIAMPPTGGETGKRNSKLNISIGLWSEQTGLGEVFDSSTGYDFTAPARPSTTCR